MKQTCSRTIQTSSADRFVRGAHHRRCAREGLTGFMMPYVQGKLQVSIDYLLPSHSHKKRTKGAKTISITIAFLAKQ
jgi:hypothetical protein